MTKRSYVDAVLAGLDEYEAAASASGALDEPSEAVRRAGCCTQSWLCAGRARMLPIHGALKYSDCCQRTRVTFVQARVLRLLARLALQAT